VFVESGAWRWGRAGNGRSRGFVDRAQGAGRLRPGHPFYQRLNELLEAEGFDEFVERRCAKFYAARFGRPSLTPGIYFRSLLIDTSRDRGRARHRLAVGGFSGVARFVGIVWMSTRRTITISRTRRLMRPGYATGKCSAGCWAYWRSRVGAGSADRYRRDTLEANAGDALDRAARYGREL